MTKTIRVRSGRMGIYSYSWRTVRYTHTVCNVSEIRIKNNQPCHQIVNAFEASPMIQVGLEYIVKSANVKSLSREDGSHGDEPPMVTVPVLYVSVGQ